MSARPRSQRKRGLVTCACYCASKLSVEPQSAHNDVARHSEHLVEGVGAFERVLSRLRNESDIDGLVPRDLDGAVMDHRGVGRPHRSRVKKRLRREIMPARGKVDDMEQNRPTGLQADSLRREFELDSVTSVREAWLQSVCEARLGAARKNATAALPIARFTTSLHCPVVCVALLAQSCTAHR